MPPNIDTMRVAEPIICFVVTVLNKVLVRGSQAQHMVRVGCKKAKIAIKKVA